MNVIFGVFSRDKSSTPPLIVENIQNMILSGEVGECQLLEGDGTYFGYSAVSTSSASCNDKCSIQSTSDRFTFIVAGRLDNASELCCLLNIQESERIGMSDYELMQHAYSTWGKECSARMFGDWVFAAWHPTDRQLVISRSHYGSIPLYYHIDQNTLAFASSQQALIALKLVPIELDELWLAQRLISWFVCNGERTPYKQIKCLPPAHYLVATNSKCFTGCYWNPADTDEIHFSSRYDYVDVFRSVFDEAVKCRLRSERPVAATLSGGLDSGSVAAIASSFLSSQGKRLTAFTSVPIFDTQRYVPSFFGDEFPFAKATADYAGNMDLYPLTSTGISPIMAIRQVLQLGGVPCHGAGNLYWLMDIQKSAKESGCSVLLTGGAGNGSISWPGDIFSQPWSFLLSHISWRRLVRAYGTHTKQKLKSVLPISMLAAWKQSRMERQEWYRSSAIDPDFARRLQLLEQRLQDPNEYRYLNPKEQQSQMLMLGRSVFGIYITEIGARNGLDLRDPTADSRVIDFLFKVPDHVFIDPKTGINRWLIREAMKGRLPDEVRLNRKYGRQSGDRVQRLRNCAGEVEVALNELSCGPADVYVDVEYMRHVWQMIQSDDTPEAFHKSGTILLRGIMAGLFVNNFYS